MTTQIRRVWTSLAATALFTAVALIAHPALAQDAAATPGNVLNSSSSFWRVYYVVHAPMRNGAQLKKLPTLTEDTPAPAKDWAQPDFDDLTWARVAGKPLPPEVERGTAKELADSGITDMEGSSPALDMICLRGNFGISDPASANLKLTLRFRGGVIVYMNGTEVGRANLAKDAAGPDALADDYPKEAYFTATGALAGNPAGARNPNAGAASYTARIRTTEITIPPQSLRKGTNVLAVEIHRTAYPADLLAYIQAKVQAYELYGQLWATCGLNSLALQTASPSAVTANIARPKGPQVWNSQTLQPDMDMDYGDPFEPLKPITLAGTRGGDFSGKIVVGSDQPIENLKGQATELTGPKGAIPTSAIQIRYAMPNGEEPVLDNHYPAPADLMDGLAEVPPASVEVRSKSKAPWSYGAVCPVWITVTVPDTAAPGDYTGKLTVSADGLKPVAVPINLKVSNWLVPKASEFHTVLDIMQSPETVAMQYNVPIYSDKHFKLLEKSLDRAGYIGSWTLHIPLICHTNLGNEESMVRWIKQPDGSFKYDFTPLEKYLDLAEKHMGKPRSIDLVVWDLFLGFQGLAEAPHFLEHNTNLPKGFQPEDIPVTMLDPATGKVTMETVGRYDEKGKANWKALADQLMVIMKKRGLEHSLHMGHAYDLSPTDEMVAFWNDLLPGVHYFRYGHYDYQTFGKTPLGISDFIVHEWAPEWSITPTYGWKKPVLDLPWMRLRSERGYGSYWKADPWVTMPTDMFRLWGEICIQGPYRGFGRMGLDYWPVLENEKGTKNMLGIQGRYPNSSWRQSDEMILCIVPPGPDGALSSSKLEQIREGQQETEARIYLEGVMTDPAQKGKLPAPVAAKAQAALDARVRALQMNLESQSIAGFTKTLVPSLDGYSFGGMYAINHSAIFQQWFMESGWQSRSTSLFDSAAEVSAALGGK